MLRTLEQARIKTLNFCNVNKKGHKKKFKMLKQYVEQHFLSFLVGHLILKCGCTFKITTDLLKNIIQNNDTFGGQNLQNDG